MDNVHLVLHILYGHVGTLEDRAASHGLRHPAEFLDAGLKLSNAMTPMNSHFPLSPGVGRPPEPGHEGDAVTQTSPPGDSRTDKCARGKGALSGRTGRLGSISCPGSMREGSGVSVSQPVSQRPEMRSAGATVSASPARASASDSALRQPKVRPTGDSANAFVKTPCPRRRQPPGPQP